MKLSEKGKAKIKQLIDSTYETHSADLEMFYISITNALINDQEGFELEASDFADTVTLSLAEATLARDCTQTAWLMCATTGRPEADADLELGNKLSKRIKEAKI